MSHFLRRQPKNSAFLVYKNDANQVVAPAATAIVHFTAKTLDTLNEFNTTTYVFTAKRRGLYEFVAQVKIVFGSTGFNYGDVRILTTNPIINNDAFYYYGGGAGSYFPTQKLRVFMEAGGTARVQFACSGADNKTIQGTTETYFSGRRLM